MRYPALWLVPAGFAAMSALTGQSGWLLLGALSVAIVAVLGESEGG